jgi:hypothetical protein
VKTTAGGGRPRLASRHGCRRRPRSRSAIANLGHSRQLFLSRALLQRRSSSCETPLCPYLDLQGARHHPPRSLSSRPSPRPPGCRCSPTFPARHRCGRDPIVRPRRRGGASLASGWRLRIGRRLLLAAAKGASALLIVHALPSVADWIALALGHRAFDDFTARERFIRFLYEPWFMTGGILFALTALGVQRGSALTSRG